MSSQTEEGLSNINEEHSTFDLSVGVDPGNEQEILRQEEAALRRAAAELAERKTQVRAAAVSALAYSDQNNSFEAVIQALDDPSPVVRSAAVRTLYELDSEVAVSFLNTILRDGTTERRRNVGAALIDCGLVREAINKLNNERPENLYRAVSLLFLLSKAGEVRPLMSIIESHPSINLRLAIIQLLASSGEPEILTTFYPLSVQGALQPEVRAAVLKAIEQISSRIDTSTD